MAANRPEDQSTVVQVFNEDDQALSPDERREKFFESVSSALEQASDRQIAVVKLKAQGREIWRPAINLERRIFEQVFLGKEPETGSDEAANEIIMADAYDAEVHLFERGGRAEQRGEFYPYLLTEEAENGLLKCGIDLLPFQIFSERSIEETLKLNPEHVTRHCLWNTLQQTLPDNGEEALAQLGLKAVAGVAAKKRMLAKIAKLYELNIRLHVTNNNGVHSRVYKGSDHPKDELQIGMISGHFFPNFKHSPKANGFPADINTLITKNKLGGPEHDRFSRGTYDFSRRGMTISTANLLKKLHEHGYTKPITNDAAQRLGLARTIAELKGRNPFIDDLFIPLPDHVNEVVDEFPDDADNIAEDETACKSDDQEPLSVFYADFESFEDDSGRHVPYLACATPRGGGYVLSAANPRVIRTDSDESLGKALLLSICKQCQTKNVRIYFHNLRYDANFLYDAGITSLQSIESDGRLYQIKGQFRVGDKTFKLSIRDTFSYLPVKLASFHSMFDIPDGEKWKDFPYELFTRQTLGSPLASNNLFAADDLEKIPIQYKKNDRVEMYRFAHDYCAQDCKVLQAGFDKFRESSAELGLDIDDTMTAASFAVAYMQKEDVLAGVEPLSGSVRAYVQESVVGGRVCVRGNEPIHYVAKTGDANTHIVDFDAVSLYPSAMAKVCGLPIGHPEKFMGDPPEGDCFYVATVRVLAIGKELNMSTLSKVRPNGRHWGKGSVQVGDVLILNSVQIESARLHQGVEFEFIGGLRWPSGWNPRIRETINKLFQWRLRLKEEKNPLEIVVKLIMNSFYGKLAQRPHDSKVRWIRGSEKEALLIAAEAGTGFTYLEAANRKRTLWKLKYSSPDVDHSNQAHCGSLILGMSKEIMYQVTSPLDDDIMYTDTDSMMLSAGALARLNRPDLIGKGMGQFHTDLKWNDSNCKGGVVTAVEAWFLAKKTYVLKVVNSEAPGEVQYHVRAKGIPNSTILATCEEEGCNPIQLYERLYRQGVTFDLTLGRPCFKQHATSIVTLKDFKRQVGPFKAQPCELTDEELDGILFD